MFGGYNTCLYHGILTHMHPSVHNFFIGKFGLKADPSARFGVVGILFIPITAVWQETGIQLWSKFLNNCQFLELKNSFTAFLNSLSWIVF